MFILFKSLIQLETHSMKAYEPDNLKRTDTGSYAKNPKVNQADQANSAAAVAQAAMQSMQKKVITQLIIIIIKIIVKKTCQINSKKNI